MINLLNVPKVSLKKSVGLFKPSGRYVLCWSLVIMFIVAGCTIEIEQPQIATPVAQVDTPSPAVVATSSLPTTQIPVTWANLNLTGKLVYISGSEADESILNIQMLDLVTGTLTTIFTSPPNAWIYYITVSPDNQQLIMSYSPPYQQNVPVYQALYVMPLNGSAPPQFLIAPPSVDDKYLHVEWAPDGRYIYFSHINHQEPEQADQPFPVYSLFRMAYPDGQPEKIVTNVLWPRVSPDSSRLVYISDPFANTNKLFIADADGKNAQEVELSGPLIPDIKDAPLFLPDGHSILFSAPTPGQVYQPTWLDKLMGVRVVQAHSVPSEWWTVSVSGGAPVQLTQIGATNLYADISPDNQYIASLSGDGIFVMNLDGSALTWLIPDAGSIASTVNWIP